MRRRVTSWQGLGFIDKLSTYWDRVDFDGVEWQSDSKRDPNDETLASFLCHNEHAIKVLRVVGSRNSDRLPVDALMSAAQSGGAIHTKETAREFHHLLCAAFVAFGRSLRFFSKAFKKHPKSCNSGEPPKELINPFKVMGLYTRLLLCILTSSSFKTHIRCCTLQGADLKHLLPRYDRRDQYVTFAESNEIVACAKDNGPKDAPDQNDLDTDADCDEAPEVRICFALSNHDAEQVSCSYLKALTWNPFLLGSRSSCFSSLEREFWKPNVPIFIPPP